MTPPTDRPKPRRIVATLKPGQTVTVTVNAKCRVQLRLPDEASVIFARPKQKAVDNATKVS